MLLHEAKRPVVVYENVCKYVVRNVSLKLEGPNLYALVGPNGSGKTTLLKLAAGLIAPEKGRVLVLNREPFKHHKVRGYITYSAYMPLAEPSETPRSYLEFYLKITPPELRGDMTSAVRTLGIQQLLDKPLAKLSMGQRKRVELAKLLVRRAPVVLVDEPTASLDAETAEIVLDLLKRASKESLVVVALGNVDEANRLGARVVGLRFGQLAEHSEEASSRPVYRVLAKLEVEKGLDELKKLLQSHPYQLSNLKINVDKRRLLERLGIRDASASIEVVEVESVDELRERYGVQQVLTLSSLGLKLPVEVEFYASNIKTVAEALNRLSSIGDIAHVRVERLGEGEA